VPSPEQERIRVLICGPTRRCRGSGSWSSNRSAPAAKHQTGIEPLLKHYQKETWEMTSPFQPQLRAAFGRTRQRVFEVLTEEQRTGWQESRVCGCARHPPGEGGRNAIRGRIAASGQTRIYQQVSHFTRISHETASGSP
jgi:hypothetical protein